MISQHTIHKLLLEIEGIEDNYQFQKLADQISAIVRSTLTSRLDALLNKYSIKGFHIVIESLEIDLEYINIHNLSNSILQGVERQLNKRLRQINLQTNYAIKHGNISVLDHIQKKSDPLQEALEIKQAGIKIQISKEPSTYFPSQHLVKILPEEARYFDAVLYYLEYGWLPKYLDIPMTEFKERFTKTILTYDNEIKSYFNRKPTRTKKLVISRILSQISKSSFKQQPKTLKKYLTKNIFNKYTDDNIQILVAAIEQITNSSKQISNKRYQAIKALISIVENKKDLEKITNFNEILKDEHSILSFEKSIINKNQINKTGNLAKLELDKTPMPLSKKEMLEAKFKSLLDSNDRKAFNKLLETDFYKTLVTSYLPKADSITVLTRALIPLILHPEKQEFLVNQLPEFIDKESELINQIYKKTPEIISETLRSLSFFESNRTKQIENLILFISRISKKQVNLILQTYFSYFSAFSPYLTKLNLQLEEKDIYVNVFSEVLSEFNIDHKISKQTISSLAPIKYSQTQLIVILANVKDIDPKKILEKYIKILPKLISIQTTKNKKSQTKKEADIISEAKIADHDLKKVKSRNYQSSSTINLLALENIKEDYLFNPVDKEKASIYLLKTLISDHYIPAFERSTVKTDISTLIKLIEQHVPKNKRTTITKIISERKVLNNQVLSHLTVQEFKDFLTISLSTERSRFYIKMYEKYHYLWKVNIDIRQIQLIFIDLIKVRKDLSEKNIFPYFYESLKKYKAWTYDVHKKRIIDIYELHSDKLNEESRKTLINYIDNIPTMQSMEFRDTMKKLDDGIPVKNAGLVLLWPFIKTLFKICDYLDKEGDFKNTESRERATLLLQYLAVKSTAIEEPYLALNKVLTGFPLEESLPQEIILTDKEKDIADALLLNVIKQWPSFNNSSAENLRGSFIIRDGILTFNGKEWKLRVESKAYDLLLGKLPWGYSMIRLTWVPYIIKVEWN